MKLTLPAFCHFHASVWGSFVVVDFFGYFMIWCGCCTKLCETFAVWICWIHCPVNGSQVANVVCWWFWYFCIFISRCSCYNQMFDRLKLQNLVVSRTFCITYWSIFLYFVDDFYYDRAFIHGKYFSNNCLFCRLLCGFIVLIWKVMVRNLLFVQNLNQIFGPKSSLSLLKSLLSHFWLLIARLDYHFVLQISFFCSAKQ